MSDSKRPTPLSEDLLEPGLPPAAGTTLLGRTNGAVGVGGLACGGAGAVKKPLSETTATHVRTPMMTPKNAWCFTPIATPSPTARFSRCFSAVEQQQRAQPATPGTLPPKLQPPLAAELVGARAQQAQAQGVLAPRTSQKVSLEQALMPPERRQVPTHHAVVNDDSEEDDNDSEEHADGLARLPSNVPQPPAGASHPSVGSEGHSVGACKRCCFFPRGRCMNGYDCQFCHYEHEKRKRKNKKKSKRPTPSAGGRSTMLSAGRPSFVPGHLMHPGAQMRMLPGQGGHGGGHGAAQGIFGSPQQHHQQHYRQSGPGSSPMMQVMPQQACYLLGGASQMGGVPMQSLAPGGGLPPMQQATSAASMMAALSGHVGPHQAQQHAQQQAQAQQQQQQQQHAQQQQQHAHAQAQAAHSQVIMLEPAYSSQPAMHGAAPLPGSGMPMGMQGYLDVPPPPMQSPRLRR